MAEQEVNRTQHFLQSWVVSFYANKERKWIYGSLMLYASGLSFENSGPEEKFDIFIDFGNVKCINKTLSSFMFGSITVTVNDGEILWFSSFADRNATFLMIQHFYTGFVLSLESAREDTKTHVNTGTPQQKTKLGSEVLRSVYDSQSTLQKAGEQLVTQGQQLANSASSVQEIHENLTISERIAGGLEAWFGRWRLPRATKKDELMVIGAAEIPDILDVEALCCPVTMNKFGSRKQCVLRVGKDGITILDLKQKIINHFRWHDVSRVRVVSPWELMITRYLIGQPDLSYSAISMDMSKVIYKVGQLASGKMEYMNPPQVPKRSGSVRAQSRGPRDAASYECNKGEHRVTDLPATFSSPKPHSASTRENIVCQDPNQPIISDSEVSELNTVLGNLKTLALQVNDEQEQQMESIDKLTSSVIRADARAKQLDSRMKNLI